MVWSFQLWVGDPNGRLKIIQEQLLTLPIVIFRIFRCKLTSHNTKSVAFTMKNYPISQQFDTNRHSSRIEPVVRYHKQEEIFIKR